MAEQSTADKTEQATPERLRRAREEGNVPTSEEVPSALIVGTLLLMLAMMGPSLFQYFAKAVTEALTTHMSGNTDITAWSSLLRKQGGDALTHALPVMVALGVIGVLATALCGGGLTFSSTPLQWKWERISPIAGFKNLISMKSFVHMLIGVVKFAIIGLLVWQYLGENMNAILALNFSSPGTLLPSAGRLALGACGRIVVAMLVIAGADLVYQRWNYMKSLRMTKQEVRDERKGQEVPMEVKSRVRAFAMALVRKRIGKAVPTADVVVTNPTHFAVALKYEPAKMNAPMVVAKGADFMAQTIKEIARKHNVPVVEKPELARALFAAVDEGQTVPETLFVAVAEVLAVIFKLRKKAAGSSH